MRTVFITVNSNPCSILNKTQIKIVSKCRPFKMHMIKVEEEFSTQNSVSWRVCFINNSFESILCTENR